MKKSTFKIIVLLILSGVIFITCKKDKETIPEANVINSFIWNGLHDYYLWEADVPNLSETTYPEGDKRNKLLNQYTDPQELFKSLLYQPDVVDKWSFLVDDSKIIDDWTNAVSTTMGFDFVLYRVSSGSSNLVGIVRYVLKGTPADKAGIKRGDLFMKINDTQLTISNYNTLLSNSSYKLTFAIDTNKVLTDSNKSVSMTAVEMQENPVFKDTIFTYKNQKVGYLCYNGFTSDFDIELNNVFKQFKDGGVNQLVVDLRYNGGGSVQSAIYLASMIYSTESSKIFSKKVYNSQLQQYIVSEYGSSALEDHFTGTIAKTETASAASINCLNLNKVYVIGTDNTASASELVINSLRPYITVKLVGTKTYGKYVASNTIKDWDQNGNVSTKHSYAMQPIIVKIANSAGVTDFVNGLTPDINVQEDVTNLLPLGEPAEPMLQAALNDMEGNVIASYPLKSAQMGMSKFMNGNMLKPFAGQMYISSFK